VNAVVVEAIPARALGALAVAFQIGFAALFIDDVVLAGHIMNLDASLAEHLVGIIEFGRLGKMCNVAGVNDEGRLTGIVFTMETASRSVPSASGFAALSKPIWLSPHLQKREARGLGGKRIADQPHRVGNAAADSPKAPRYPPRPCISSTSRRPNPCPRSSKPFLAMSHSPCGPNGTKMAPNCAAKQETSASSSFISQKYTISGSADFPMLEQPINRTSPVEPDFAAPLTGSLANSP